MSHALWQSQFGGDPGIVGKVVRLDGTPHTVVEAIETVTNREAIKVAVLPGG